ncbi:response regulator [Aquicoccus sp. SCR17]|nr:response regulator [Carideicomes alvinocaridis]
MAGGVTLLFLLVAAFTLLRNEARRARLIRDAVADFVARDAVPCVITDRLGQVERMNAAARRTLGVLPDPGAGPVGIGSLLSQRIGDMGPLLLRLQSRAEESGRAEEDVVTPAGPLRIAVHVPDGARLFWRIERLPRPEAPKAAEEGLPMMTVGRSGTILSMNEAARHLLGGRVRTLEAVFATMPPRPGEPNEVVTADGPRTRLVAEIGQRAGRRELYLLPPGDRATPETGDGFDTLPVPMLKLSAGGEVIAANADARELLADPQQEGRTLEDLMEGLGRPITDWLREAAEGRGPHKSEFLRLRRPKTETFVQVTLRRIPRDEGGASLIAVLTDATELKTLEAQFAQSQKMQAIGQLAGGVAHDFNNLLTAISGHCDLLLLRHDQSDGDYSDLVQIHQNANRAAALVGQLLAFSRKQTLQPEVIDLRDTLADLTHLLNRLVSEKVDLVLGHDPLLAPVRADPRQLEQVLMNLVVNARDAMPEGGEIRIETENLALSSPLRRDRAEVPPGDYVCIRVVDEGSGIPPDQLGKIFEPFFTTKRTGEGTGLGLSTAYGIVKQTGGYIFADSREGEGTCFTLLFPAHDRQAIPETEPRGQEAPRPAPPETAGPAPGAPAGRDSEGVVLLVEDEAPVRAFASRALRMRGYTVLEADCAEAALRALEDESLDVDVFVTDVIMPDMDGPSWVRRALKDRPDTRVVFVSGYAENALGEDRAAIPNSVFLPKPFSLTDLTELVGRQLH